MRNFVVVVKASDPDGSIEKVDLFADDQLVKSSLESRFRIEYHFSSWIQSLEPGKHVLRALAYDREGSTAEDEIKITIE